MEKRTIPIIIALFSISILLSFDFMPVYADTIVYYSLSSNNVGFCLSNTILAVGETPMETSSIIHNKAINSITLTMYKASNPTGDYYVGVWANSTTPTNANYLYLISQNNSASLTTTPTQYTFTNLDESYLLGTNDVIGVFYGSGTAANNVCVRSNNYASVEVSYDGFASQQGIYSTTSGVWGYSSGGRNDLTAIISITDETPSETPNIISGIDCSLPANENKLICALSDIPNSPLAGNVVIGSTESQTGLLGVGCRIGLVDCTEDTDPRTNGLGLLIFVASIFVVVGMFVSTQGMENTVKLPVYLWAMIIIALSAFFTITELIDPVFLIISIIGLIALAAPKIVSTLKGGSSFGSGSTE